MHFAMDSSPDQVFHSEVFKQGVTFEWVKNKIAEKIEAQYQDLSLYLNNKRIPEPFCLIDMNVVSDSKCLVNLAEGALFGEALRAKTL